MTKKDYERAATIAQEWMQHRAATEARAVFAAFLRFFHEDGNPRFDAQRFRRACAPGANVKARGRKRDTRDALTTGERRRKEQEALARFGIRVRRGPVK